MNQSLLPQKFKSDLCFRSAFMQLRKNCICSATFNSIKVGLLAVVVVINSMEDKPLFDITIAAVAYALAISAFGFLSQLYEIKSIYSDKDIFLLLADLSGHSVTEEKVTDYSTFEGCVSKSIFDAASNLNVDEMDDISKKVHLDATTAYAEVIISNSISWIRIKQRLYTLGSIVSMIFSIFVLSSQQMSSYNTIVLSTYIVAVGLTFFKYVIFIIIICLLPLGCFLFLCYFCCCKRRSSAKIIDVPSKKATMQDIVSLGGDCSICYQAVGLDEEVYVLPCSQKHVFHCDCLSHWLKVKSTCPNCRQEIPMKNQLQSGV